MDATKPAGSAAARQPTDLNPRPEPALDFVDKSLAEMTPEDYDAIGFMAGLEVHQQLATRGKLFCRCPAGRNNDHVDAEVLRHMRPTLSELGEYDGTALMEFKTRKEIVYRLERGSVCTYEMDDTPPFPMDEEAVRIAIEVARVCNINLVSELHVMRKQYLDGSIPTGFQRTAMVGLGGDVPFHESELGPDRRIRIRQLSLEEDSCREVSDVGHRIVFRTDRLGVPLTETVTEPDLLTPRDVQAGARLIAALARSTGKVARGAGAARQDVNVSVAGGRRVEIKGVDNHRNLPRLVHIEAFRQLNLLRVKAELERRGVEASAFALPGDGLAWDISDLVVDASSVVRRSDYAPVQAALELGEMVCAVRLPGFRGLLNHRTQPGITFARELSGRVRVIACLTTRPFMIHSDIQDYGLVPSSWGKLRKALKGDDQDAVVVVWGPEPDVATAARELLARAAEALVGVPSETRQAYHDGTTGFERILPGPDRMYPDTDTPPLPVPDAWVEQVEANLPERPWERLDRYRRLGFGEALAQQLLVARYAPLFDALHPADPDLRLRFVGALQRRMVCWWRERGEISLPPVARVAPLVEALDAGRIHPSATDTLLDRLLREPAQSCEQLLEAFVVADPEARLAALIEGVVEARGTLRTDEPAAVLRWAMGQVMRPLLGSVDPAQVKRRLGDALALNEGDP